MTNQAVSCDICGQPTKIIGTRLCDPCWECKTQINSLISRNPEAAIKFLKMKITEAEILIEKLKVFRGTKDKDMEVENGDHGGDEKNSTENLSANQNVM